MINSKGIRKKRSWHSVRYYPSIRREGLWNTMKHLSQDSRCADRYLNLGPLEYEAAELTTPSHSLAC
jgi:hypothetical protein